MEKKPLPWLNMIVSEPFYLSHFLLFFSYFVVRSSAAQVLSPENISRLLRWEIQATLAITVYTVVKMVKEESWEAFFADTLFYGKGLLLGVALIMDYHLAFCYFVGFLVLFVSTQQPVYDGLGNSVQLTPLQLETLLTEGNTSRFWLVEFRALCTPTCIRSSRLFPELSVIYSNKNLSFGIVDLGLFPNAAEKFGISLGVGMGQLPTYILFDNAVEVARFPEVDFEAKASRTPITKRLLCRYFELDRHLVEYLHGK
ncbi:thioredoxin-related transmembrane protein 2 isoform X3 [Telopea speciosissima]|uniref:thioredoxin-related transmembrane protein 2 isoform X3 n=1 Tax=Telopea speciosissima TaxID=54955 RepID=UPI001CC4F407|nr:thioredoxin-related transmembrane protein 2 isoform X3 [Telopea speciosissima]